MHMPRKITGGIRTLGILLTLVVITGCVTIPEDPPLGVDEITYTFGHSARIGFDKTNKTLSLPKPPNNEPTWMVLYYGWGSPPKDFTGVIQSE